MKTKINHSKKDTIAKAISGCFVGLFIILFVGVISFVIYGSIPGWQKFGFVNIFGTLTYDLDSLKASAWPPLCITLMVAGLALLIGGPIGVKTATFIKFRVNSKAQRYVRMVVEILADMPSVIFGVFTLSLLGPVVQFIFRTPTQYNLISTGFMLGFMIMPTVVSLNLSALDSVEPSFITSPIVLGNTRTTAIYKVYKKQIRGKIIISLIAGISRALGETMATSMILQSQSFNYVFSLGFVALWTSYLKTLGGLIASNMFAETLTEGVKGLLFVYGLFLMVVILLLNALVKAAFRDKNSTKRNPLAHGIITVFAFIPRQIRKLWHKIINKNVVKVDPSNLNNNLPIYFQQRSSKEVVNSRFYDGWKIFWEWFCFILTIAFILTMLLNIIINGVFGWMAPSCTVFQFGADTTGQAFVNTLLVIIISVGIGFVIALASAIFLNEFCKEGKFKKGFMFFVDSFSATPTIIYGMFGMVFFLQILGMSSSGTTGKSVLAAAFTLVFVILPTFTRSILQALQTVSQEVRQASYALGVGRWETVRKIVLPKTLQHIFSSVVISIGRVLAETAPLYLTAGLNSGSRISLMSSGQTLTTRIYAQINTGDIVKGNNIMYECALLILVLVLIILLIVDVLIPKHFEGKQKREALRYNLNRKKEDKASRRKQLFAKAKQFYNLNLR